MEVQVDLENYWTWLLVVLIEVTSLKAGHRFFQNPQGRFRLLTNISNRSNSDFALGARM